MCSMRLGRLGFLGLLAWGVLCGEGVAVSSVKPSAPLIQAANGLVPLRSAQLPFTLSVPQSWAEADLKGGMGGVSLQSSTHTPYSLMRLLYAPRLRRSNLAGEISSFEAGLRRVGSLKQPSEQPASYGGLRGVTRTYTLSGKPGVLNIQVWFGAGARNMYSFVLTAAPQRFAADQALFTQVLSTIRF